MSDSSPHEAALRDPLQTLLMTAEGAALLGVGHMLGVDRSVVGVVLCPSCRPWLPKPFSTVGRS
jgi:hypothetical protein